jgi:glycosyltransferase involved in cell wall biosynthesis
LRKEDKLLALLSVVLATFNEETNLKDCLESVKDIANEIVVVDGGSQDKTVEIAKKMNAKVIETTNPTIFHINKNKAINAATSDWILQLDADERVSTDLSNEIRKVINDESEYNGFWIPRSNYFLGRFLKKGGQYPDYTLRLYRKGKGKLPARDVHEQAEVEGKVGYLNNDLLHLRDLSFTKYLEGLNRYTDIIAIQMKKEKLKLSIINLLVYTLFKPSWWFLKTFFRHKGFMDGYPGFVFSLFSSFRYPISYIKYWSNHESSY